MYRSRVRPLASPKTSITYFEDYTACIEQLLREERKKLEENLRPTSENEIQK